MFAVCSPKCCSCRRVCENNHWMLGTTRHTARLHSMRVRKWSYYWATTARCGALICGRAMCSTLFCCTETPSSKTSRPFIQLLPANIGFWMTRALDLVRAIRSATRVTIVMIAAVCDTYSAARIYLHSITWYSANQECLATYSGGYTIGISVNVRDRYHKWFNVRISRARACVRLCLWILFQRRNDNFVIYGRDGVLCVFVTDYVLVDIKDRLVSTIVGGYISYVLPAPCLWYVSRKCTHVHYPAHSHFMAKLWTVMRLHVWCFVGTRAHIASAMRCVTRNLDSCPPVARPTEFNQNLFTLNAHYMRVGSRTLGRAHHVRLTVLAWGSKIIIIMHEERHTIYGVSKRMCFLGAS